MVSSNYLETMNAPINQLVRSLFQKDSIDQCSIQELQQYAERHPYFGAAQLLLTKKLQSENNEQYNAQLQKTLLFFHNPLWVEQLLDHTGSATVDKPAEVEAEVKVEVLNVPQIVETRKEEEIIATGTTITPALQKEPVEEVSPIKIEKIEKPGELLFEPYHTVDYFASQGIKFKEEERPKDKFGQQLKSFTDWLKTMKRLPVTEIAATVDNKSEQKVEQLAEISLQERDVVTETMAEVWEKQGNHEKAIDIYNKLSLLEPTKSTYFAAKIEELKKKN